MKKILLALGYIAGVVVGAKFAHKNTPISKKKTTKKTSDIKDQAIYAGKEFIATHKNAFDEIKKEFFGDIIARKIYDSDCSQEILMVAEEKVLINL